MQFRVFRPAAALAGLLLMMPLAALAQPAAPADQPELQVADLPPQQEQALPASAVPPIDKTSDLVLKVDSAGKLSEIFDSADYALADVRDGEADVPRLLVEAMPGDLRHLDSTDLRKDVFFNTLLPLVLRVNEDIRHDRDRLLALQGLQRLGLAPSAESRAWLAELSARYEVADGDIDALLLRVDVIPVSLALAQAAVESGWGTSYSAQRRNALFGQTAGSAVRYAAFDRLIDGVASYARNLNTHPAYSGFRARRAALRAARLELDGYDLASTLTRYSTRGTAYIRDVRAMIRGNDLAELDSARLAADRAIGLPAAS
ncbi:glucosaminidase domain-containing protein [Inquilinus limosus]|uniref:glucosaminidase domain-containing protein n=1 Tax=Inquilinus limosus TaxID=171674 RepID=UPI00068BEB53|nr:glucosaminidase domain-containing protein [Inquilinus limosus]